MKRLLSNPAAIVVTIVAGAILFCGDSLKVQAAGRLILSLAIFWLVALLAAEGWKEHVAKLRKKERIKQQLAKELKERSRYPYE